MHPPLLEERSELETSVFLSAERAVGGKHSRTRLAPADGAGCDLRQRRLHLFESQSKAPVTPRGTSGHADLSRRCWFSALRMR
jgi:hypothetical protein